MLKKIIDKLYRKYGSRDWVAMTKLQLVGTTHEFNIEELGAVDRRQLSTEAKVTLENPAYLMAANNVKNRIMKHIQEEAPTAEVIFYDRMMILGVKLIEEELESYALIDLQASESFDQFKAT